MSADAWPEFGEHPALVLLRVSGNERVDSWRGQAPQDFSRQVREASGTQPKRDGLDGRPEPDSQGRALAQARAGSSAVVKPRTPPDAT
ncbi:hypothetical protein AB0D78_04590 [Streptomyces avermitilis]|uniref:hypothetical protein n=1 Tax=Streptomyces avermitilis TaxID=33903 RepID=UPI0033D68E71